MDILGLGVLIVGESGIGKSECALDLVVRGHRLVADDAVELRARADAFLIGHLPGADAASHGDPRPRPDQRAGSVRRRVDAARRSGSSWWCSSSAGIPAREYDRLGLDEAHYETLGIRVPMIRMPVAPGRNLAILVEVAARNQLLRNGGLNAARRLADRLDAELGRAREHGRHRVRRGYLSTKATKTTQAAKHEGRASEAKTARGAARGADGGRLAVRRPDRAVGSPASRRRSARSRTSATSASTTCRSRCCRCSPS